MLLSVSTLISVQDEFRSGGGGGGGGGLKSLALIFFHQCLHENQLSGFARILPDLFARNGYLKSSRGAPAPPPPHGPYAYEYT